MEATSLNNPKFIAPECRLCLNWRKTGALQLGSSGLACGIIVSLGPAKEALGRGMRAGHISPQLVVAMKRGCVGQ